MTPTNFLETIDMNLPECDKDIRNVVSLLYEKMYDNKDDFAKFPSCSEGMLAIQDACDLYEQEAPVEVIYADILSNLLKHPDDIETFKIMLAKDANLKRFIKILDNSKQAEKDISVKDSIYQSFFSKEIQQITGMKERYERNERNIIEQRKKLEEKIRNLSKENEELLKTINMQQDNYKRKENIDIATNGESTQQQDRNIENKKQDLVEFEEASLLDEEVVYVPTDIVNRADSIFDGNDAWYEIMEFEVEEVGWQAVKQLTDDGTKKIIDRLNNLTHEEKKDAERKYRSTKYCSSLELYTNLKEYSRYSKELNVFLDNMICYDGIILKDIKDSTSTKIVTQKIAREGKNYYKILSNEKIQNEKVFENNLISYLRVADGIGINGLRQILDMQNIQYKFSKNFLLFSYDLLEFVASNTIDNTINKKDKKGSEKNVFAWKSRRRLQDNR